MTHAYRKSMSKFYAVGTKNRSYNSMNLPRHSSEQLLFVDPVMEACSKWITKSMVCDYATTSMPFPAFIQHKKVGKVVRIHLTVAQQKKLHQAFGMDINEYAWATGEILSEGYGWFTVYGDNSRGEFEDGALRIVTALMVRLACPRQVNIVPKSFDQQFVSEKYTVIVQPKSYRAPMINRALSASHELHGPLTGAGDRVLTEKIAELLAV